MRYKFAVISAFLGRLKDRFKFYNEERDLDSKFKMVKEIPLASGLELVYPYDFEDVERVEGLLRKYGLEVAAINVDIKGESKWNQRALTSEEKATRKLAIEYISRGCELSMKLGANLVTVCPLQDGYDYHFEMEYKRAWKYFVDGVREVANAYPNVRISLEYKFSEPLMHYLLGTVHAALFTCMKVDLPNVGVTLDTGHALLAGENPAESLALLMEEDRLFHVHINDNNGKWDWDLIAGGNDTLSYVEFLYYLRKYAYNGWVSLDVTPKNRDPIAIFGTSLFITDRIVNLVEQLDASRVEYAIANSKPDEVLKEIYGRFGVR